MGEYVTLQGRGHGCMQLCEYILRLGCPRPLHTANIEIRYFSEEPQHAGNVPRRKYPSSGRHRIFQCP